MWSIVNSNLSWDDPDVGTIRDFKVAIVTVLHEVKKK